ncbi:MAG: hypothetical protein NT080_04330, partial [Spirochaetes bacterium]|nr:hypothetical protein [Spirochaetota bacterium]
MARDPSRCRFERVESLGEAIGVGTVAWMSRKDEGRSVEFLEAMQEHRTVVFGQDVFPDMHGGINSEVRIENQRNGIAVSGRMWLPHNILSGGPAMPYTHFTSAERDA